MFDLIVKNANLPNGKSGFDIGCKGNIIMAIEKNISAEAGQLLMPVDTLFLHLSLTRIFTWTRRFL